MTKPEQIAGLKAKMKPIKQARDRILEAAPSARDTAGLQRARNQIRRLKRRMRKLARIANPARKRRGNKDA